VASRLVGEVDLAGRNVALDPLHTRDQTAALISLEPFGFRGVMLFMDVTRRGRLADNEA
jgi:hypothetical protein